MNNTSNSRIHPRPIQRIGRGTLRQLIEEGVISSNTSVEELTQSVQEVWNASAPRNE